MKFLFYSKRGDAAGMALRIQEEGNEVDLYIEEGHAKNTLKNIVPQVNSLQQGLSRKPDLVVFDMVGNGQLADRLRKAGHNVIGASAFADRIELDRKMGMDFCKKVGIKTPEYTEFKTTAEAIKFVQDNDGRYVLKPSDNQSTALTYVARDSEDMVRMLEWAEKKKAIKGSFILQEFIPGIELSTEVWFSNGDPILPGNSTIELKKFMAGDKGPNTGCMASVVWPWPSREPRIIQQTLKKMFPALKAVHYTGPMDINTIVTEDSKACFLEFTPRFGYNAVYAFAEILKMDMGQFLHDITTGSIKEVPMKSEFGMALRISIPPFPTEDKDHTLYKKLSIGKSISGLPMGHAWLLDAMKTEEDGLTSAGVDGVVCEISYSGSDLQAVSNKVYEMAGKIEIADAQYRVDGAERALKEIPKLKDLGYEVPSVQSRSRETDQFNHQQPAALPVAA